MSPETTDATYTEELYQLREPLIVAIDRPWHLLTATDITLLGKVLNSVRQNLNTVRVIQFTELGAVLEQANRKAIIFGLTVLPEIASYQHVEVHGSWIIKADPLNELDDIKKKNLWSALQQMFKI